MVASPPEAGVRGAPRRKPAIAPAFKSVFEEFRCTFERFPCITEDEKRKEIERKKRSGGVR
jgi:hypothetical protein